MSELHKKNLWVTSVQPFSIDGEYHIPTAVFYGADGEISIGIEAVNRSDKSVLNDNFKIELGEHTPGSVAGKTQASNDGEERTAFEISQQFINSALALLETELKSNEESHKIAAKILVAEPLSFSTADDRHAKLWIQNYRDNVRRILNRYEEVDFLPEPFAVYQYYRYGQRIPQLQDKSKHIALVLDFGGGTFDACVIESTVHGDISLTGKHSKPLAADSCAVGGFEINLRITEYLIKRNLEGAQRKEADQCISAYKRVRSGDLRFDSLGQKKINFIENFKVLQRAVEQYKLSLVSSIKNWSLSNEAYERVRIKLPSNPFEDGKWIEDEFFAHQFRKIFEFEVWAAHLKRTITKVFKTAQDKLDGKDFTVTLISGGSSNIKWLTELLERDFKDELEGATSVPIGHSFQEVVSNGLAIECARRFYDQDSEFVSVTYNPIKLHLMPDDEIEKQARNFTSIGEKVDMLGAKPGDLMPSAQALHNFIDQKLQWKIRLSKPPKRQLRYIFSKPGLSAEDGGEVFNAESQVVYTRDGKHFDSFVTAELLIKEDGTAFPSFIYKTPGADGAGASIVEGRPFAIDMTTGVTSPKSLKNYVGFDFGSSCSSLCLLTQEQVKITASRADDPTWVSLSDALSLLPYPVAYPLRKYLNVKNSNISATVGREAFESALAFVCYVAVAELYAVGKAGKKMKSFQHRSMGPLKGLLIQSVEALGAAAKFSKPIRSFLDKNEDLLDKAILEFNNHKHEKLEDTQIDVHRHLSLIIKLCVKLMKGRFFGYVADSVMKPYEDDLYVGVFKVAHDIPPFPRSFPYESKRNVSRNVAVLVDLASGDSLPLFPLVFWADSLDSVVGVECYWYDKPMDGENYVVKPCDKKIGVLASAINGSLCKAIDNALKENSTSFNLFSTIMDVDSD
ncbi:hypothetical protein [Pseudomonas viridiflava]|uniref:hypothetical protein n=1 Tax=Pseudomonas syringae group TaxID=136849 RepID=UPI000F06DD85|nr:hypothetical protein [Pseudomonas viridiflava]